jgi:hypothetical protein
MRVRLPAGSRTAYPAARAERGLFFGDHAPGFAALPGLPGIHVKMTDKTWCAISKAVEMIKTAQNTNVGQAEAWLIEACVAGNIRSRMASFLHSEPLLNEKNLVSRGLRPGSRTAIISRKRVPKPVLPAAWKDAMIDGDVLVDINHGRWPKQTPPAWPTNRGCDSVFALIRGVGAWRGNLH